MRSNRAQLLLQHDEYKEWKDVRIYPVLQHVGTTSWTCGFRVTNATASLLLALVETTMVSTDAKYTIAQPIEHRSTMLQMIEASRQHQQPVDLGRALFSKCEEKDGVTPHCYSQLVRVTDCDALNHINNAVYATLAEEARVYTASQNKYSSDAGNLMGRQPGCECSISYIGQAHPFETMDIETWSSGGSGSSGSSGSTKSNSSNVEYRTDFFVNGKIVSQTLIAVPGVCRQTVHVHAKQKL